MSDCVSCLHCCFDLKAFDLNHCPGSYRVQMKCNILVLVWGDEVTDGLRCILQMIQWHKLEAIVLCCLKEGTDRSRPSTTPEINIVSNKGIANVMFHAVFQLYSIVLFCQCKVCVKALATKQCFYRIQSAILDQGDGCFMKTTCI